MRIDRLIEIAKEQANLSTHRHKMGAVVFSKTQVVSKGFNIPQKSVKHLLPVFQRWEFSIHAEVGAILNARRDLKGKSMLVIRKDKEDRLHFAKPCTHCIEYLKFVGIKKVIYSVDDAVFREIKL
jgi:deoxycytidylate deaminase